MLSILATPLLLFFLAIAVGLSIWRFRPAWGVGLICVACVSLYVLSTPLVGARLLYALEPAGSGGGIEPAAIVILGGDLQRGLPDSVGETIGPLSLERVREGARLHRRTGLPIMTTGGLLRGGETAVAAVMAEVLRADFRVPVQWVEAESTNTYENAVFAGRMLAEAGVGQVYLVTHGWHLRRALEAFERAGLSVIPISAMSTDIGPGVALADLMPSVRALTRSSYALHEVAGLYWYRLAYY